MIEQLGHFHFLRPEWLLLIPGLLLFERLLRNPEANRDRFHDIIAPELLEHLRLRRPRGARFNPSSVLAVLLALLTLVMQDRVGASNPRPWLKMPPPW